MGREVRRGAPAPGEEVNPQEEPQAGTEAGDGPCRDEAGGSGGRGRALEVSEAELPRLWSEALDAWLASYSAAKTQYAYRRAMEDLLSTTGKWPWEITPQDVQAWAEDMRTRHWHNPASVSADGGYGQEGKGLAPATIAQRLAAASSFYKYTMKRHWVDDGAGGQRPLGDRNPAAAVRRPVVVPFAKATFLDEEQVGALLRAIPRRKPKGLQAYALIVTYLLTGRRCRAIRTLRWGDLRWLGKHGTIVQYRWTNKGKTRWDLMPPPAWDAIEAYLRASGRLIEMVKDSYLFTPLSDDATRLPLVDQETWTRDHPLSAKEVTRIVKRYARKAGLDERAIHVHTLRHTAAELYRRSGDDIYAVSKLLAHSSVNVTRGYFDHMEGHDNVTWRKVAEALRLDGKWRK
ncbi:MAG: tyrosine-type recombinase/integrase [Anaerolineae bacterium]|nr:tyrosine-type recombinase/integrase [Anaerolineae bacterium]